MNSLCGDSWILNSRNTCGWLFEPRRTRKLQTVIEVCMGFASLRPSVNIHRRAKQAFVIEEDDESEEMFAMMSGTGDPSIVIADVCPR